MAKQAIVLLVLVLAAVAVGAQPSDAHAQSPLLTLSLDGARGVYIQDESEEFYSYVIGAPTFVNAPFTNRWVVDAPSTVPPSLTISLGGARGVYIQNENSEFYSYVIGAPTFVNAPFRSRWVTEVSAPAPAAACVLADSVERVVAATFQVQTPTSTGTAFYIGNGEWITNHHVVETVTQAVLVHGSTRIDATVAGSSTGYDLALLSARPPASARTLRFAAARPPLASSLSVVGFPSGVSDTPSITRGVVSKHAPMSSYTYSYFDGSGTGFVLQVDAAINPGNSGGPIVDDCGDVVGVATFSHAITWYGRDIDGISFGVAAETVTAQLASLRSATHHASTASSSTPALEIVAVCNRAGGDTLDDCHAAEMRGVDPDEPWAAAVGGVSDWDNVRYRIDGGAAVTLGDLQSLEVADGRHTIEAREQQAAGWTAWSAPYVFEVRDRPATLVVTAICNGDWETAGDCRSEAADGLDPDEWWQAWVDGVDDYDNARYSIDGGSPGTWDDLQPLDLADGRHTVAVIEQQAAGWTAWSAPYVFEVRDRPATLVVTAICNGDWETAGDCRSEAADGLDPDEWWQAWVDGVDDYDNARYSIDGGSPGTWDDLQPLDLADGRHTVAVIEQQAAGWTAWSAPYVFEVRDRPATLVVTAICNGDWETAGDCRSEAADGLDPDEWWQAWVDGADDYGNVRYSIDGGPPGTRDDLQPLDLADGVHTVAVIEQQAAGWTAWSAPYVFDVRDRPSTLVITAFCTGNAITTIDGCRATAADGLDSDEQPHIGIRGVDDRANMFVRIDGGAAVAWEDRTLRGLGPGRHTIEARELQAAGWTEWSAPYTFTIRR